MFNYEITSVAGKHKSRKRVGRGTSSGHGKTSGKGHKGQKSRSGAHIKIYTEGGQMPLFRRLPKRGFSNFKFEKRYEVVNVSQLERFEEGAEIGAVELSAAGLVDSKDSRVKILGDGDLTKKLSITAHKFSKAAEQKILASGGKTKVI